MVLRGIGSTLSSSRASSNTRRESPGRSASRLPSMSHFHVSQIANRSRSTKIRLILAVSALGMVLLLLHVNSATTTTTITHDHSQLLVNQEEGEGVRKAIVSSKQEEGGEITTVSPKRMDGSGAARQASKIEETMLAILVSRLCDEKSFSAAPAMDGDVAADDGRPRPFLDLRGVVSDELFSTILHNNIPMLSDLVDQAFERVTTSLMPPKVETGMRSETLVRSIMSYLESQEHQEGPGRRHAGIFLSKLLVGLDLGSSGLSTLPDDLAEQFPNLEVLFLTGNKLARVPPAVSKFTRLSRLSLKGNLLVDIDPVHELPLPSLVHLILTENRLQTFVSSLLLAGRLRKLMLAGNELTSLGQIFLPTSESELSLHMSPLASKQPSSEISLREYVALVSSEPSRALTEYRTVLSSIELVRLTRNRFASLATDDVLHTLALLTKLRWVSFAGNPATSSEALTSAEAVPASEVDKMGIVAFLRQRGMRNLTALVDCSDLNPRVKTLGHGTSGIVKLCPIVAKKSENEEQQKNTAVAVKFFKKVSSDGSGEDECKALGLLPQRGLCSEALLVPHGYVTYSLNEAVVRRILPLPYTSLVDEKKVDVAQHETFVQAALQDFFTFRDGEDLKIVAMVFPLVHAKPMGKSPNMWTATDDIFDASTVFPLFRSQVQQETAEGKLTLSDRSTLRSLFVLRSALSVVDAIVSMHSAQGGIAVVHGDLYAHNIFFGTRSFSELCRPASDEQRGAQQPDAAQKKLSNHIGEISRDFVDYETLVSDFGASFGYRMEMTEGDSRRAGELSLAARARQLWRTIEARSVGVFLDDMQKYIFPEPTPSEMTTTAAGSVVNLGADLDARSLSVAATSCRTIIVETMSAVIAMCLDAKIDPVLSAQDVLGKVRFTLTAAAWRVAEALSH